MPQLWPFQDELPMLDLIQPLTGNPDARYLLSAMRPEKVKLHRDLPANNESRHSVPVYQAAPLKGIKENSDGRKRQ